MKKMKVFLLTFGVPYNLKRTNINHTLYSVTAYEIETCEK